jgi:hypothetical protein
MKKVKLLLIAVLCLILNLKITAQTTTNQSTTSNFSMGGQVGLSIGKYNNVEQLFFNLGGPNVKLNYKKVSLGASMYPSLRMDLKTTTISPTLGAGLFFSKSKYALTLPMYYFATQNKWIASFGVSYKFN